MVLFVEVCNTQGIFDVSPDIVLYPFRPCNLIGSESVEELVLLTQSEPVRVDPSSMDTSEETM
jgi:hypothetical protein